MSSNPQPRWAVLDEDDDEIYDDREDAARALAFLREADMDYRLYEIREVQGRFAPTPSAAPARTAEEDLVSAIAESLRDFQVSAGGMLFTLTETERRRIGWTVRGVCRQPLRNEEAG